MPYVFFPQGLSVPCTLLHYVGSKLKDVATGTIIAPENRVHHFKPLDDGVHKVSLARVFPGCDDVVPPIQPVDPEEPEDDDEAAQEIKVLRQCFNMTLLWPKAQIRLGCGGTTP